MLYHSELIDSKYSADTLAKLYLRDVFLEILEKEYPEVFKTTLDKANQKCDDLSEKDLRWIYAQCILESTQFGYNPANRKGLVGWTADRKKQLEWQKGKLIK